MPTNYNYYKQRWRASKVNLKLSYGMFDNGNLVGFIINAIGKREETLIAFNTGTGVLPNYRNRRITKAIYQYALNDLKANGITKYLLEVITENHIAIKAYKSIGFKKTRTLKCFKGSIDLDTNNTIHCIEKDIQQLKENQLTNQQFYSWDNQLGLLKNNNYNYFEVTYKNNAESYFILHAKNGTLAQFELFDTKKYAWKRMFQAIKNIATSIKINNIDSRQVAKINFLASINLQNTINQYEMIL